MNSALAGLGVAGLGYVFLWIVMQRYFKQMDSITTQITNLVMEVTGLISTIAKLRETQAVQQELDRQKISKIETLEQRVLEIHAQIIRLVKEQSKIPFGKIAMTKGYLNRDQVEEIVRIQNDYYNVGQG